MGFISIADIVIMLLGIAALFLWLMILVLSNKYNNLFENLDDKEYPLHDLYSMGYYVLERFHYDYKSKRDRQKRKQLEVLYSEKYADYYLRVIHSQQITFSMLIFVLSFIVYGITGEIVAFILLLAFAGLAYYYFGNQVSKRIDERSEELINEFSEVVSKLALLTNAGMIMREAWEEVAYSQEGIIYEEMKLAVNEMQNGVSDVDAIRNFGSRCMLPEIKKFTSTIIQGMTKGTRELVDMLQKQSSEVWDLKRQLVKRQSAKAESKLMVPMLIMLIGVLIMIMIPIFSNLGV